MATEFKELAKQLEDSGYKQAGELLRDTAASWNKRGLIPDSLAGDQPLKEPYAITLVREIISSRSVPYPKLLITLGLCRLNQTQKWLAGRIRMDATSLNKILTGSRIMGYRTAFTISGELNFSKQGLEELTQPPKDTSNP